MSCSTGIVKPAVWLLSREQGTETLYLKYGFPGRGGGWLQGVYPFHMNSLFVRVGSALLSRHSLSIDLHMIKMISGGLRWEATPNNDSNSSEGIPLPWISLAG